ncbi:GNAT family N-acetyltransferase [Salinibacterium sp. ZJ454]|uniref:GNAT family N-acetyltransferase n=1 Tax=Salinibacterium sp. ZJ454 TaxID=2708339 RepID=UPI0014216AF7|nr:GNAT family N-acetyltransferase [Salinibacterium sp. ZJ454]
MRRRITPEVQLLRQNLPVLRALAADDLEYASDLSGVTVTPFIDEYGWLWRLRWEQVQHSPVDLDWIAGLIITETGQVVGHAGFHSAPDTAASVEVAYSVDPAHRRNGYARAALGRLLERARRDGVAVVRASISPDNVGSLALIAHFGFVQVGEQWDDQDGLELVFELPLHQIR